MNSPEIRKWLGETVGKEGETLDRHDRWLCMMYPRLTLLKQFLTEDGVIFISIDDNEVANLKLLLDEIMGSQNEIATLIWEKGKKGDSKFVSVTHEHVVIFAKNKNYLKEKKVKWRRKKPGVDDVLEFYKELKEKHNNNHQLIRKEIMAWYRSLPKGDFRKSHKHYNWSDDRGLYFAADFAGPDDGRENRPRYDIIHPVTNQACAIPSTGWRWEESTTKKALAENPPRIHFGKDHTTIPNRKSYLHEVSEEPMLSTFYKDGRSATLEVERLVGAGVFQFPKDSDVIADLINVVVDDGDLVLDSFGGSGTTAHAVLKLNKYFKKALNFILVELDSNVAKSVTATRIKKVINGYTPLTGKKKNFVEGLGGEFQFCTLSQEPLFDASGHIRADVSFSQLAEFVWFSETGTGYTGKADSPLLGVFEGRAIYLLYNGILKDLTDQGGNILTKQVYDVLPKFDGAKVIYAAANRLGIKAKHENIVFKQTPYALEV